MHLLERHKYIEPKFSEMVLNLLNTLNEPNDVNLNVNVNEQEVS